MRWNLVALYSPASQSAAVLFNRGLEQLQSDGEIAWLIKPFQRAAADPAQGSSRTTAPSVQPAVYLQTAVADSENAERLIEVADVSNKDAVKKKPRGSPPALYTKEQAEEGAVAYYQNCAMCHGPLLDGQEGGFPGPALKGPDFADPSYDFHVNEIFNFVAKLMPSATPGSLSPEQDVQIMAFILRENGYPAGAKELTYDGAAKSRVPMRYYGK
jgi:mono/diheme cytochrome c family protein